MSALEDSRVLLTRVACTHSFLATMSLQLAQGLLGCAIGSSDFRPSIISAESKKGNTRRESMSAAVLSSLHLDGEKKRAAFKASTAGFRSSLNYLITVCWLDTRFSICKKLLFMYRITSRELPYNSIHIWVLFC